MIVGGIYFGYSKECNDYQYQAISQESYIKAQMALVTNGYTLDVEEADYAYFSNGETEVYVERNY